MGIFLVEKYLNLGIHWDSLGNIVRLIGTETIQFPDEKMDLRLMLGLDEEYKSLKEILRWAAEHAIWSIDLRNTIRHHGN